MNSHATYTHIAERLPPGPTRFRESARLRSREADRSLHWARHARRSTLTMPVVPTFQPERALAFFERFLAHEPF